MSKLQGSAQPKVITSLEQFDELDPLVFAGLGQHLLVDLYGCANIPSTAQSLELLMLETAKVIEATVVTSSFHEFSPQGLSGVVVISESHIAAHTWPEHGVVCVDIFTCSQTMNSIAGLKQLFESLAAESLTVSNVCRGKRMGIEQRRESNE